MPLSQSDAAYLAEKLRKRVEGARLAEPDYKGSDFQPAKITPPDVSPVPWERLEHTVRKAEPLSIVWRANSDTSHYPWFLRPFAALAGKVILYLGQVITKPQQAFNAAIMEHLHVLRESLQPIQSSMDSIASRFHQLNGILAAHEKKVELLGSHIEYLELSIDRLPDIEGGLKAAGDRIGELTGRLDALKGVAEELETVRAFSEGLRNDLSAIQRDVRSTDETLHRIGDSMKGISEAVSAGEQHSIERYEASLARASQVESGLTAEISKRAAELGQSDSDLREHFAAVTAGIREQETRFAGLLEQMRNLADRPGDPTLGNAIAEARSAALDSFYLEFENRFRGTREEIRNRISVYLDDAASVADAEHPVVDLGCGRGEWLALLKERGIAGIGIDNNSAMAEECRKQKFDIREMDALEGLRSLPGESAGMVTGFHIVEHLPFDVLVQLFDETRRVLKRGGVAVFETPNPDNVIVGSSSFYTDPTHVRPLPPSFLKFVAEQRGFVSVELRFLHPADISQHLSENTPTSNKFNHYFFGPRDYAVVARKV